jgi:subtilisin family serine protease
LSDKFPVLLNGSTVWYGYARQPAATVIRHQDAKTAFLVEGAGTVAIIDTGVDPFHPALSNVLVPGYDFTRDEPGSGSEMADLGQSTAAVVDDGSPVAVNGSTVAVLNQSTAAVVDDPRFVAFGHGTMTAGIVHLVAPKAQIMPLKAFHSDGTGYTSDIIRAIYWAASANVKAINMSFSTPAYSRELKTALNYAVGRRITPVSSAGNNGARTIVFPAAFDNTIGVASTDISDNRSSFSNYGNNLVWLAAPGEGIVSTYPFSTYAAGWGTSYSTPFVTGTVALLEAWRPGVTDAEAMAALAEAKPLGDEMGHGRLDIYRALQKMGTLR